MKSAETQFLLERAVQHVLSEQAKVLKISSEIDGREPAQLLGELTSEAFRVSYKAMTAVEAARSHTLTVWAE